MSSGGTKEWTCACSGECCRGTDGVEVTEDELRILRDARPEIRPLTRPSRSGHVEIVARPCPYLDGNLCSVYAVRPWRCRSYGCFRRPGEAYVPLGMYKRLNESAGARRTFLKMIEEAKPWAMAHGWAEAYDDAR